MKPGAGKFSYISLDVPEPLPGSGLPSGSPGSADLEGQEKGELPHGVGNKI